MKGKINFGAGSIQHVYQKTANGFLIFYSVRDYLVFYTIFSCVSRMHDVRVMGLCQMVDHLHVLVRADSLACLRSFVHHYTTWFSRMYNQQHHLGGSLFSRPFGFAAKTTSKEIRSAIAYLYNNPVERHQCTRPELSRWNFLAYGASNNPFSDPIRLDKASRPMRYAMKSVVQLRNMNSPLSYTLLGRLFDGLALREQQQLVVYIISTYNCIDHAATARHFGGYRDMVMAVNTTKGGEYDLKEEYAGVSDQVYKQISRYLLENNIISNVDEIMLLSEESRIGLKLPLAYYTDATPRQIVKYLRLPDNHA